MSKTVVNSKEFSGRRTIAPVKEESMQDSVSSMYYNTQYKEMVENDKDQ